MNARNSGGAPVSRRQALSTIAAATIPLFVPVARGAPADPPLYEWRGQALGARSRLLVAHADRRAAARAAALVETRSSGWSGFQPVPRGLRTGRPQSLRAPRRRIARSPRRARRSGAHCAAERRRVRRDDAAALGPVRRPFRGPSGRCRGSARASLEATRRRIDHRALGWTVPRVRLLRPGMAVTLNGIAQGYVTDRVAELLRDAGFASVLVSLAKALRAARPRMEFRGASGSPTQAARSDDRDAGGERRRHRLLQRLATQFDAAGRHHHLFDPRTGRSAYRCAR